jgi:hypothetical protein
LGGFDARTSSSRTIGPVTWPAQKRMYLATPCERVLTIEASHSAYFSKPDELAEKILIAGGDRAG